MDTKDLAQKEIEEVLKKYGLRMHYRFDFPVYRITPDEVKLTMRVLDNHKMQIVLDLRPEEPKK